MTAFAVSSENNRFAALDAKTVEFICPDQAVPDETAASKNWNLVEEKVTEDKEAGLVYVDRMYMDGPAVSTVSYTPFTRSVERSRSIYKASSNLSYGELILTMYVGGTFSSKDMEDIQVKDTYGYTKYEISDESSIYVIYVDKKFTIENNCGANFLG